MSLPLTLEEVFLATILVSQTLMSVSCCYVAHAASTEVESHPLHLIHPHTSTTFLSCDCANVLLHS
jgi:hypothetical protein